ncbi:MAG: asparagine synthase C-terminal domain-containing protein [bacterium]
MDKLAGRLRIEEGKARLAWEEGCAPVRMEEAGTEAVVLGPAARRRDDLARRLARNPSDAASALASLREAASGFSFALWEPARGRLSLGCDPLGLQTIYFREAGGETRFGGRLADVAGGEGVEEKLHLAGCEHFLLYLSAPPGRTLLGGVRRVAPGRRIHLPAGWGEEEGAEKAEGEDHTIFPLRPRREGGRRETATALREALQRSVRAAAEGVPEDEPLGLLLSGGIDSTALLALLRETREGPIVAIQAARPGSPDRHYAKEMAAQFGAEFLDANLSLGDARESLAWLVFSMELPSGNASAVATSRAFALARERGVRRVLSGLGSDEVFCGHAKHLIAPWWPLLARLPRALRKMAPFPRRGGRRETLRRALAAEGGAAEMHKAMYAFFGEAEQERLRGTMARLAQSSPMPWRAPEDAGFPPGYGAEILQVDLNMWLRASLTPMAGALAAVNGLELALPFCGPELLGLSAAAPLSWKVRRGEGKRILREALAEVVPPAIFRRPRQGFTVPMAEWLRTDLAPTARELLSPGRMERWCLVGHEEIAGLLRDHIAGRADWSLPLWAWMTFSVWYERFVEGGEE